MLCPVASRKSVVPGYAVWGNSCMNTADGPDSFELGRHRDVPRRRWPIVFGLAVFGLLVAAAYVAVVPQVGSVYTATAVVDVSPPIAAESGGIELIPGLVPLIPDLHGQAQVVRSIRVAAIAGRLLHSGLSPLVLSEKVTVAVPPNSSVLDIGCKESSARDAASCANSFAHAYLQNRSFSAAARIAALARHLKAKRISLENTISSLNMQVKDLLKSSAKRPALEAKITADSSLVASLTSQIAPLAVTGKNVNGGMVITAATEPTSPGSPSNLLLVLPSGLMAGLLVGLIAAFLLSRRDQRIHSARDA